MSVLVCEEKRSGASERIISDGKHDGGNKCWMTNISKMMALLDASATHLLNHSEGNVVARAQAFPLPVGHLKELLHCHPRRIKLGRLGLWAKEREIFLLALPF